MASRVPSTPLTTTVDAMDLHGKWPIGTGQGAYKIWTIMCQDVVNCVTRRDDTPAT